MENHFCPVFRIVHRHGPHWDIHDEHRRIFCIRGEMGALYVQAGESPASSHPPGPFATIEDAMAYVCGLIMHPDCRAPTESAGGAWSVVHFVGVTPQGWGWAFWLPVLAMEKPETCCGFRSQTAAQAAAHTLRTNRDRIRGDLPNAVFEPFALDEAWAFLDTDGQVHATFPTARDAFTAAAKKQHGEPAKN